MSQKRVNPPVRVKGLGATGKFPQGKIDASDEGEIKFAVTTDTAHGVVMIDFGSPVVWVGLPPAVARELGHVLLKRALELEDEGPLPAGHHQALPQ